MNSSPGWLAYSADAPVGSTTPSDGAIVRSTGGASSPRGAGRSWGVLARGGRLPGLRGASRQSVLQQPHVDVSAARDHADPPAAEARVPEQRRQGGRAGRLDGDVEHTPVEGDRS